MKILARCSVAALVLVAVAPVTAFAQATPAPMTDHGVSVGGKPLASPAAVATTTLAGQTITINYNTPSMRGRKIFGGLVPYGEPWRLGANPATTIITPVDLTIGDLKLPAGTYTLFALPTAEKWTLIVSKKTGEWGIPYPAGFDFGRTPMMVGALASPQEVMSLSFEKVHGKTAELHMRWETTDAWVKVVAK